MALGFNLKPREISRFMNYSRVNLDLMHVLFSRLFPYKKFTAFAETDKSLQSFLKFIRHYGLISCLSLYPFHHVIAPFKVLRDRFCGIIELWNFEQRNGNQTYVEMEIYAGDRKKL